MQDILGLVEGLRRPRLLIRAARFGVNDYHRSRHLPRLLKGDVPRRAGPAIMRLLEIEASMELARMTPEKHHSIAEHVEVLIALMAETRTLKASRGPTLVL